MPCTRCNTENARDARFCSGCNCSLYGGIEAGERLRNGRIEVRRRINHGGMGAVFEVWEHELQKRCALKEMICSYDKEEQKEMAARRFKQEAVLLFTLDHPGLPRVREFFSENGLFYIVMEYIDGENLLQVLEREGRPGLPQGYVRDMAVEVLKVLEYLHAQNPPVLYRDLKPSNVMQRRSDGRFLLIDFSIAKSVQSGTKRHTAGGGTACYRAPEQVVGKTEQRSDLYSLGVTMHCLLSRRQPMEGEPVPTLREAAPAVSHAMAAIIERALEYNPADRFPRARSMREALEALDLPHTTPAAMRP